MKKVVVTIVAVALGVLAIWSISGTKERALSPEKVSSSLERTEFIAEEAPSPELAPNAKENAPAPSGPLANAVNSKGIDSSAPMSTARLETGLAMASIAGRVYDVDTNAGVPGAKVTGRKSDNTEATTSVQETDSMGCYHFEGLENGDYIVTCFGLPEAYVVPREDGARGVTLYNGSAATGIDFAVEKAGTLEGTVTENGVLVTNARLMTEHYASTGQPRSLEIQTDGEGRYQIRGLEKGGRRVAFSLLRGEGRPIRRKMPVIIAPGATTVADVEFYSGSAAIEGVVYQDENTPLAAHIEAYFHDSGFIFGTTCDSNGMYQLAGLPAEPVEMLVYMGAKPDSSIQFRAVKLELAEGQTVHQDICLSTTTLTCRVVNLPRDSFIAFVLALDGEVDLSDRSFEALYLATQHRQSFSILPPGGIGEITALEPGTYTVLAASAPGDPSSVESLEGEELEKFMSGVAITPPVIVTIEQYGQSLSLELSF